MVSTYTQSTMVFAGSDEVVYLHNTMRTILPFTLTAMIAVQALTLHFFGQPTICACGTVRIWEGVVASSGNSQQFTDWYTYSHIIHGILFFLLLRWLLPRASVAHIALLALGVEIGWELLENTPWVIDHYREQALAAGYTGDSVLNSVSDSLAMLLGFFVASRIPLWLSVMIIAFLEIVVGYSIRDNLTLNVLNLLWQTDAVTRWQSTQ